MSDGLPHNLNTLPGEARRQAITRPELYELVWNVPIRNLGKELGLTAVELTGLCQQYGIPRPPAGHWSKVAHGKPVQKAALPEDSKLDQAPIELESRERLQKHRKNKVAKPDFSPDVAQAISSIEATLPISVPDQLEDPHKFVKLTERAFYDAIRSNAKDRFGQFSPSRHSRGPTLLISVTELSVPRSLRLTNAILRSAVVSGLEVKTTDYDHRETICIKVLGEHFAISVHERKRQVPHILTEEERAEIKQYGHAFFAPKIDYVGTGDLTINVWPFCNKYRVVAWKDDKRVRLEVLIGEILLRLPVQVQNLRNEREFQRQAELERQQEEQIRMTRDQRRRRRKIRVDKLLNHAEQWRIAENLRGYARAVEAAHLPVETCDQARLQRWLTWVSGVADHLDPVSRQRKATTR